MINMTFTLIGVLLLAYGLYVNIRKQTNLYDLLKSMKFPLLGAGFLFLLAIINPYKLIKVDPAIIGLKVSLVGSERGVSGYEKISGRRIINTFTHDFVEIPKNLQNVNYKSQKTFAKGGFGIDIAPTFNYKVNENTAGDMYVELRKPLSEIEEGWLNTSIMNSINEVINKYSVDYIFNNREAVENEIAARAKDKVKRWFVIDQFKANLAPPESLQKAVEDEAKAIKEAQAMQQVALKEEAAGKAKVAKAKADSASMVINASAKAEAIRLTQKTLTKEYIEFRKVEKWDGRNSTHVLGSNSSVLVK